MSRPSIPQSVMHATQPAMEAAVNEALRRVVNDGVPLVAVLDEVFHAGVAAGYRTIGDHVAFAARTLESRATVTRTGRELGGTDPGDYAAGLDDARAILRRATGIA